ncbi:trypsin-like peptidase domain-containing protein [Candidatus Peregrinibacteria bacterium]|nr:MAG: trypsin-like peptidase domain-containing protein [Candidatus Peregrinibacteria bacterium]
MRSLFWKSSSVAFFALLIIPFSSSLAESGDILSPTVKIIPHTLTKNGNVLETGFASGTILSADGFVLTNHHVVVDEWDEPEDAFAICVVRDEKKAPECHYQAVLIGKNKKLDVALLKILPNDIFENPAPEFPFLKLSSENDPKTGTRIRMVGFPGIGGKTITETEGQVSGYDDREGIQQMKTDAVISPGNSGGTVLTTENEFVGVPSYLQSAYTSIGYIIPATEINSWLQETIKKETERNPLAEKLLQKQLLLTSELFEENVYSMPQFPYLEADVPSSWDIVFANDTNLSLSSPVEGNAVRIQISARYSSFKLDETFLEFILEKIEKNSHFLAQYKREKGAFGPFTGYDITFDNDSKKSHIFLGISENVILTLSSQIPHENEAQSEKVINEFLKKIRFLSQKNETPEKLQSFSREYPAISIQAFGDMYINSLVDNTEDDLVLSWETPESYDLTFSLYHERIPEDIKGLSREKMLEEMIRYQRSDLLNQYENVMIDGLPGFAYTISAEGDKYGKDHKQTVVYLLDGDYFFEFLYDDLSEEYEKRLGSFLKTLESFTYSGDQTTEEKGIYNIPNFTTVYDDVRYHLYESEITALASKNILAFPESNFFPEIDMGRMKALAAIIEAKKFVEEGQNITKTTEGLKKTGSTSDFLDVTEVEEEKLLAFALEKKIISKADRFFPKKGVTLAETLKMLCTLFEIPVWNPPYSDNVEWYVPYMYRGMLLDVLPPNVTHDTVLSRGEFAHVLYRFIQTAGERYDF